MDATTQPVANRTIADLPGPPSLPIVGSALQMDRNRMHAGLEQWAARYGEAYTFKLVSLRVVVVSNPEVVATVLRDRPDTFRRSSRLEQLSREFGFLGLFSASGETWRRQRPMVLAGLDPTHIKAFFPTLIEVTERFARHWGRAAAAGTAIDLQADLMRYTVDVTAALAFGEDINTIDAQQDQAIQQHLNHILPALFKRMFAPFPVWKYFPNKEDRAIPGHLQALQSAVRGFIARAARQLDEQPALRERPVNLIQAMLAARDRDNSGISEGDVSGNVLTMLLAGEDTTANTLAWLIWLLQRNPDALRRASEEAKAVLGGRTCARSIDELARLDYIEACAYEAMRLKPVAPLIGCEARKDAVVAGIEVPAGTLVICLMRPGALDAKNFEAPLQFDPQRWLEGAGAAAHSLGSSKRVVMPFGAGPRICPGRYLALAEIKMVAAMLLANFEIAEVSTPDGEEPQERLALTMYPVGLSMRLRAASSDDPAVTPP
ncbi:cytochrome P450 [Caenimonas terrae]|uniref:Cytochrome P450 n=1 Tax=Caenimonas terrae TaxID=696074 RepID=A0ABW0NCG4_9BURK